jgi:molecular chaperone IbpA
MTNLGTISSVNYERYLPSLLGFESAFAALDNASHLLTRPASNFPPVNVIKHDDYNFSVELAVAGYKQEEIDITAEKNSLRVEGKKPEEEGRTYLVKGIAGRSFSRQFVLSDTVVVRDAKLADGILTIHLENVIPEEQKPRKVSIG